MIVAVAIGLAFAIQAFVAKPYQIPSKSMEPTLDVGQRVLVNRLSSGLGDDPDIGDVIVFHPPRRKTCSVARPERRPGQACPEPGAEMAEENFIKRVVAGPGDRLRIAHGIPIVDGVEVTGDWEIRPCRGLGGCDFDSEITIPPEHYFMMGDNRGSSQDSRYWGPVPRDWIIGKAVFTYWPPERLGTL